MCGTIGSVSDWRFTKARGKEDEVYDQNNKQTDNVSSRISSGLAWISWDLSVLQCNMKFRTIMYVAALNRNFDSDGAFEGSNCSPIFMKPSGTLQNIRLQTPRHRSLFDRRGRSFFLSPLFIDQPHMFLQCIFSEPISNMQLRGPIKCLEDPSTRLLQLDWYTNLPHIVAINMWKLTLTA